MNRNRDHANTPSRLTTADRERQRIAVLRHDAAKRAAARREALSQFLTICAAVGVVVYFAIRLTNSL